MARTAHTKSIFGLSIDGFRSVTVNCDPVVLGWLAGLLEGEGSFMSGSPSKPNLPRISIQMTDLDVMEKVGTLLGLRLSSQNPRKHPRPPRKTIYSCQLRGSRAVALMKQLRHLMGSRRQAQIDKALAGYKPQSDKIYPTIDQILEHGDCSANALAKYYGVSHSYIVKLRAAQKTLTRGVDAPVQARAGIESSLE